MRPSGRDRGGRTGPGAGTEPQHDDRRDRLDRLDALAIRMDRAFRFPLTRIRFGWDSILGLVPGVGDTLTMAPAIYILQQAHDMGASKLVLVRMVANIGIDWLVGLVPLIGDIVDVGVKSNSRNVALLRDHLNN
ncbi:DUF4112 domain-containing protein [Roseovarius tibetensis]|uniref:DUF4112 domain-containing protein n=1 Tax=Roseovarius tibetensis TaxID=2685897 RepID=UPI003D7FEF81